MEITFEGKRILVTGAGQGIGRGLAKNLVVLGGDVVAVSRTAKHLDSLKAECPSVTTVPLDISDWNATRGIIASLGPFDYLVNNAGMAILEKFLEAKPESFDQLFNINVKAVLNISQIVAQQMIVNKIEGSIVNISSQASMGAVEDHAIYCSSKAALDMLSKAMALELGQYGIRVNCVNPTVVMTAMGKIGWSDPAKANKMLSKIPLNKFAEVQDVVDAVIFLLSDRAAMINGTTLPIDGGFLGTRM